MTITNVKGLFILNNNRKDKSFRQCSLHHKRKPKTNWEKVEFIATLNRARGLHWVCPYCSFGFSDKLSKAINTDVYHECGRSVWLGKSTGMGSWRAVKIASCDAVHFCVLQQIFQHILLLFSQLYFGTNSIKGHNKYLHCWNDFVKNIYATNFTENAYSKEVKLYI